MIRDIVKDPMRLSIKSSDAGPADIPAADLQRTAFAAMPILTAGDVTGAVAFLDAPEPDAKTVPSDLQRSLIAAASQFLGRQLEA